MNCSELTDGYDLYALGVLDEPERSELREHLARSCEVCSPEVRRAALRVASLAETVPIVEPPDRLRGRVMAGIGVVPRRHWNWMQTWATVAAAVLLALFWMGHVRRERVREIAFEQAMEQLRQSETESARLKQVLAVLNAPDTIVRVSSEGARQPPQGKVFLNPSRGALLLASNLPPAPEGKIYEMWVIPAGGNPMPAGLFQTESNGAAVHLFKGPVDVANAGAVAVTLEAAGGAPQPTTQPIIVAPVKKS
jgi:anti-sigma-K factor RskA